MDTQLYANSRCDGSIENSGLNMEEEDRDRVGLYHLVSVVCKNWKTKLSGCMNVE